MANVLAPFGFSHVGYLEGQAPTYGNTKRLIAKANATAFYFGDPVVSLSTGYITQATAGTTQVAGVFIGCEYLSTALGYVVRKRYWPGSDAANDVTAWIINAPNAIFVAQTTNGGPAVLGNVGNNANFALGTGNTANGLSGASIDFGTIATTSTLPFRILSLVTDPPTSNGTDTTSVNNWVLVGFNNVDTKSLTGI